MKPSGCMQCPRQCGCNREETIGFCTQSNTFRIARAAPHFWEEPAISGRSGSGTIFFCGCNLRCCYCQNSALLDAKAGIAVTPMQLMALMLSLQDAGVHNINLVTASHYTEQLIPLLQAVRSHGLEIPVVWNSSAYESVESLRLLDGLVNIYLPDFKYSSKTTAADYSHAPDYPDAALHAIEEMLRQVGPPQYDENGLMIKGVQIRHLVLPGHAMESRRALWMLQNRFGNTFGISIMNQYTPMPQTAGHPKLSRTVSEKEYDSVIRYALQIGLDRALIQEQSAASQSFIPDFTLSEEKLEEVSEKYKKTLANCKKI